MTTRRRTQVLLAGAPTGCWTNTGDEAVLGAMLEDMRKAVGNAAFTVVSSNPTGALEHHGIAEVPYSDLARVVKAARASDLLILGGGSIFFDYWGFDPTALLQNHHGGLSFYTGFALLATLLNKPLMIYAVGVGPLGSEIGRTFTRITFEQAHVATVRDAESLELLRSLDVDVSGITVTADPAFGLRPSSAAQVRELAESSGFHSLPRPIVGVALREWNVGVDPAHWEREVAAGLERFRERSAASIAFLPLHRKVDWPLTGDSAVARRVQERLQASGRCVLLPDGLRPRDAARVLRSCDLVLGMRLHSLILSFGGGIPCVALAYDPKVRNVMRALELDDFSIDLATLDADRLLEALLRADRDRSRLKTHLGARLASMVALGRSNAGLAAKLLRAGTGGPRTFSPFAAAALRSVGLQETLRAIGLAKVATLLDQPPAAPRGPRPTGDPKPLPSDQAAATLGPEELGRAVAQARQAGPPSDVTDRTERVAATSSGPRRVAILTNRLLDWETRRPRIGGAERYALNLARLLADSGFEVTFYQVANSPFEGDFFGFRTVALAPGESFSEFQDGVCDEFYRLTLGHDHVIYLMPNFAAGQVREDALLVCHGLWFDHDLGPSSFRFRSPEWFARLYKVFARPRRVVSVDTNSINFIRALWPEIASRLVYLPNWVDTDLFFPPPQRGSGPLTIIIPRRSDPVRGSRLLAPIVERIPHDCRILWVGDGEAEDDEHIRGVARRDPRVAFIAVPFAEMPHLYRESEICLIPSVASEGTSLSCLEGLASGCAVVATTIGGLPDLIQPGVNGLLVDPEPTRLAAAVNSLIEQPDERYRLQGAAVDTARHFDARHWRQRWTDLLGELGWLESTHPALPPRARTDAVVPRLSTTSPADLAPTSVADPDTPSGPHGVSVGTPRHYDVICFSIIDWDFRWQRPQQLMTGFAREGHRVFYLSTTKFWPAESPPYRLRLLRENVWEVQLAIGESVDVYRDVVSDSVARSVADAIGVLRNELGISRAIAMVEVASWAPAARLLRRELGWSTVYDCMDNWSDFPGIDSQLALLEEERRLAREADLLVVSSQSLWDKWSGQNPSCLLARNAADFDHFQATAPSSLFADAPRPVVGYFGAIAEWFDVALMYHLAVARPRYTFVLIGGVYGADVTRLEGLPNVRLLGEQPYAAMPGFLASFDVCIVPFQVTPATQAMDLVKLYEFLAQGKPTVVPPLREVMPHRDLVYVSRNADEFLHNLDEAAREADPARREQRIAVARQNTWSARLASIKKQVRRLQRKQDLAELLKRATEDLLRDDQETAHPEDQASLSLRTLLHVTSSLSEREHAVSTLVGRLRAREEANRFLSAELKAHRDTIAARDEAVAWLQAQLTSSTEAANEREHARSAQIAERDRTIAARDEAVAWLQAQLTSSTEAANEREHARSAQIAERDRTIAARDEAVAWLQAQLTSSTEAANEREHARSAQIAERDRTIAARDEAIAWLQAQLTSSTEAANEREHARSAQIAERDRTIAARDEAIAWLQAQLTSSTEAANEREHARSAQIAERDRTIAARDEAIVWLQQKANLAAELQARARELTGLLQEAQAAAAAAEAQLGTARSEIEAAFALRCTLENAIYQRGQEVEGWRAAHDSARAALDFYRNELYRWQTSRLWKYAAYYWAFRRWMSRRPAFATLWRALKRLRHPSGSPGVSAPAPEMHVGPVIPAEVAESSTNGAVPDASVGPGLAGVQETTSAEPGPALERATSVAPSRVPEGFPTLPGGRYDVVIFSIIDWDFRFQRPQQIATQYARCGHRVLFLSTTAWVPPTGPGWELTPKTSNIAELKIRSLRALDIYGGKMRPEDVDALEASFAELAGDLAITDALALVQIPFWTPLVLRLAATRGWRVAYDCMDEWTNFPGFGTDVLRLEDDLVRTAEVTVVSADRLVAKHQGHARRLVLARNGVDLMHYERLYGPNTVLADLNHPVIGYYGALASWVDVPLLEKIASAYPEGTIVLAGGHFDVDLSRVTARPNVRLLGQRPYYEMPQLLYHFDACVIPFLVNDITQATNPVKFYEYCYSGKPVVAPRLTELVPFEDVCYLPLDHDGFLTSLDAALHEDPDDPRRERRRQIARDNDWRERYRVIHEAVTEASPLVSVIIVTYGGLDLTRACLDSLRTAETWPNLEILVVDNASPDGTLGYLESVAALDPRVKVLANESNLGFAAANNRGLAASQGSTLVLLNNDTVVPPGLLSRMVAHLSRDPYIGLLCPTTNFVGNEAKVDPDYTDLAELPAFAARRHREHAGKVFDIHVAAMYCVAMRRDAFDRVGALDEAYGIGMFEDDDYAVRMRQAGLRVVCAEDAYVHHVGQGAFAKLSPKEYNELWARNQAYYEQKFGVTWKPHQPREGVQRAESKIGSVDA